MDPVSNLAEQIRSGQAPQNLREFAAQGLLPFSEEELVPLQIILLSDSVPQVAGMAATTLRNVSEEAWNRLVEKKDPDLSIVDYVLKFKPEAEAVKEKLLLNHSLPDSIITRMASTETGRLVDVILNNHVRMLREPTILENLEANPALTADQKRRIEEFKTEFIYKKRKPVGEDEIQLASLEDLLAQIPNLDLEAQKWIQEIDQTLEERPSDEQAEQAMSLLFSQDERNTLPVEIVSVYQKILTMKHSEKVRVALLGGKEERTLLIRDPSRQVASLVLRNPKLTEQEMDGYSSMRNIDSELLRQIGQNRQFLRRYSVIHALVRNPKTPSPTSLNLLKLLREADLKNLERDKNIPDVIRRQAKKIKEQRQLKKH